MAQADSDLIVMSASGCPRYGRNDGVGIIPDAGGSAALTDGLIAVANGSLAMPLEPSMICYEFEDFLGDFILNDVDSNDIAQGVWSVQSAGTSPVHVVKSNSAGGAIELKTSATSEVSDISMYWGDQLNINSDKSPILITRLQYQTIPAAADSLSWGFTSARNALIDSTTNNAIFKIAGANNNLLVESDDNSTNDDDNDTTYDMTAGTYLETMISMHPMHGASATDVRFYYRATLGGDWTRVLDGTTFAFGANTTCQPMFQVEKTSGTTTPDLLIDYAAVIWQR